MKTYNLKKYLDYKKRVRMTGFDATRVLKDGIPCPIIEKPKAAEDAPSKSDNAQPTRAKAKQSPEDAKLFNEILNNIRQN